MSNETYRQFDPWRPLRSRRFPVDRLWRRIISMSITSPMSRDQIGSFERYFVQENNGDTVAVLAVTDDGMIPLVEQVSHRQPSLDVGFRPVTPTTRPERPTDVAKRKLAEEAGFRLPPQAYAVPPVL